MAAVKVFSINGWSRRIEGHRICQRRTHVLGFVTRSDKGAYLTLYAFRRQLPYWLVEERLVGNFIYGFYARIPGDISEQPVVRQYKHLSPLIGGKRYIFVSSWS